MSIDDYSPEHINIVIFSNFKVTIFPVKSQKKLSIVEIESFESETLTMSCNSQISYSILSFDNDGGYFFEVPFNKFDNSQITLKAPFRKLIIFYYPEKCNY